MVSSQSQDNINTSEENLKIETITLQSLTKPIIETLLFLYENPSGLKKSEFRKKYKTPPPDNELGDWEGLSPQLAEKIPRILFQQNILTQKIDPKYHIFILTEQGKQIAQSLKAINAILGKRQFQILLQNDPKSEKMLKKEGHLIVKLLEAIRMVKSIYQIPIAKMKDSPLSYQEQEKIEQIVQQKVHEIEAILKQVENYIKEQNIILSMKRMNELIGGSIVKNEKPLQKMTRPVFDLLLYLLDHPEGLQKSEFRGKDEEDWAGMSPNTGVRIYKMLYEKNMIEPVIDDDLKLTKTHYTLTEDGVLIAEYLRVIEHLLFMSIPENKVHDECDPTDELNNLFVLSEGGKMQTYLLEAIDLLIQKSQDPVINLKDEDLFVRKMDSLKALIDQSKSHLMKKIISELRTLRFNRVLI